MPMSQGFLFLCIVRTKLTATPALSTQVRCLLEDLKMNKVLPTVFGIFFFAKGVLENTNLM